MNVLLNFADLLHDQARVAVGCFDALTLDILLTAVVILVLPIDVLAFVLALTLGTCLIPVGVGVLNIFRRRSLGTTGWGNEGRNDLGLRVRYNIVTWSNDRVKSLLRGTEDRTEHAPRELGRRSREGGIEPLLADEDLVDST